MVHFLVHIQELFQFDEQMAEEITPKQESVNLLLTIDEFTSSCPGEKSPSRNGDELIMVKFDANGIFTG